MAAAAGTYALAVATLWWRQHDVLYRAPKKSQTMDPAGVVLPKTSQLPALHGWVDNPGQEKALLYYGGSSEPVELRREAMARAFPGHTRYFVPYRGFGPNSTNKPTESGIKADAMRLFELAHRRHCAVDALGRSLGTGVALHVASQSPVRKLGLITPYDSILSIAQQRYRWLPVRQVLRDWFESWRDAPSVRAPILALLADQDTVTPHAAWESLRQHLSASWGETRIPETNHTNIVQSPSTWAALSDFFGEPRWGHWAEQLPLPLVLPRL